MSQPPPSDTPGHSPDGVILQSITQIARDAGMADTAALAAKIAESARQTADPETALNRLEQFLASATDTPRILHELDTDAHARFVLLTLLAHSRFFTDVLMRQPDMFRWLLNEGDLNMSRLLSHYRREVRRTMAAHPDRAELRRVLSRMRRREMVRIGLRDILNLGTVEETTREISELAQALTAAAAETAYAEMTARYGEPMTEASPSVPARPCGMCVLGMGKLGGRELNFSSDIDLIFIYDEEGQTTGLLPDGRRTAPQSNHVFFTRMGEAIVKFLSGRDTEAQLYRVDMRLRPEGKSGPLARSLDSFLNYLRQQARDWERLAYLKARVLTGPATLAERIYRFTQEFVFSETDPALIVREVERLKEMIDREVTNSDVYHREVKRGYGGIREIEFVIFAMQIIYGRMHRALRARNIFVAIERLREVNLLPEADANFLLEAYSHLREVEHCLQMEGEAQTHLLPEAGPQLDLVARKCGFADGAELMTRHESITRRVHEHFTRFFQHDTEAVERLSRELLAVLNPETPEEEATALLARHGLGQVRDLRLLRDLAYGTREIFISAEGQRSFEQMLPSLLRLTREAPNPTAVLPLLHSFMLAIKGITYYYELVAQHPDILRLLVRLFGSSALFGRVLIAHPEFFDAIISSRLVYEPGTPEEQAGRLSAAVGAARSIDRRLVLLRRAVRFEELLIAVRHLLDLTPLPATLAALARAADAALATAVPIAAERLIDRLSPGLDRSALRAACDELTNRARAQFAIIALGKYGGRELNFLGDLDVVFVFDESDETPFHDYSAGEMWTALAHDITAVLSENVQGGRAYVIDSRLRPHGRNSPLATALGPYLSYLADEAEIWELQTFLRSRHAWGNAALTNALRDAAARRRSDLDPQTVAEEMRTMRQRLEESVTPADANRGEFKRSAGGLVDIEFALQYLGLTGAVSDAETQGSYFDALATASESDSSALAALAPLRPAYSALRAAETAVRLVRGVGESIPPTAPEDLRAVEHLLQIEAGTLLTHLTQVREQVRSHLLRVASPPHFP